VVICGFQAGLHYAEPDLRDLRFSGRITLCWAWFAVICGDLRFSGRPPFNFTF